jgi:hypothetical protein
MSSIESTPKTLTDNQIEVIDNENNNNCNNTLTAIKDVTSLPSVDDNDFNQDTNQMSTNSQTNRLSFRSNLNYGKNFTHFDKIQTNGKHFMYHSIDIQIN